jgi:hypothetical protein
MGFLLFVNFVSSSHDLSNLSNLFRLRGAQLPRNLRYTAQLMQREKSQSMGFAVILLLFLHIEEDCYDRPFDYGEHSSLGICVTQHS